MKKITVLLVMAVMISGFLFVGCGGQRSGSSSSSGLTTLKVWGNDGGTLSNDATGEKVSYLDVLTGKVPSKLTDRLNEDLAKRGIKLEVDVIDSTDAIVGFQTLLASGRFNTFDFVKAEYVYTERSYQALVDQGRLYPLNQLVSQYSTAEAKAFYNSAAGKALTGKITFPDGNWYWMNEYKVYYYKTPNNPHGSMPAGQIRQDWLDKLGLKMPTNLDEFYNALVAFRTQDANGSGKPDEVANIKLDSFSNGVAQWFGLAASPMEGDLNVYLAAPMDGKIVTPWYQAHVKDYITYMQKLYNAGVVRVSSDKNINPDRDGNFLSYDYDWALNTWTDQYLKVPTGAAKAYYVPFMLQAYPDTPPRIWRETGYGFLASDTWMVPKATKQAAALAKLIDYLVSPEYQLFSENGIENYNFRYDNGAIITVQNTAGAPWVDMANQRMRPLRAIFPRNRLNEDKEKENLNALAEGAANGYADSWHGKYDFITAAYQGKYAYVEDITTNVAFPTPQELDRIAAIQPDLFTYSQETLTNLIMGRESLNNWDAILAKLKSLGLDEFIQIYQARYDRLNK